MQYIKGEHLKYKRTMVNRILFLAPTIIVLFAFLAAGIYYFQYSSLYWWYMFLLQGLIGILCFYSQKIEEDSEYQQLIYSLPINLKKASIVKNIIVLSKLFFMESIFAFFVWLIPEVLFPDYRTVSCEKLLIGNMIILITSAWQIPFCSLFMKKIGKFLPIVLNVVLNLGTTTIIGKTPFWVLYPYCWTGKEMEFFLGIELSGVPMRNRISFQIEDMVVIILSVLFFGVLMYVDAQTFEKGRK